jgi:Zn-finger nucleic acid-binding protein
MFWKCPECQQTNDIDLTRCMACGHGLQPEGRLWGDENIKDVFSVEHYMDCPKCNSSMQQHEYEPSICKCFGCHGVWIDISGKKTINIDARDIDKLRKLQSTLGAHGKTTEFPCPSCHSQLLKASKYREIDIEWCPKCWGMYFDGGEIRRVVELHRDGKDLFSDLRKTSPGETTGFVMLDATLSILAALLD